MRTVENGDLYAEAFVQKVISGKPVSVTIPKSPDHLIERNDRGRMPQLPEKDVADICLHCNRKKCQGDCTEYRKSVAEIRRSEKAKRKEKEKCFT